MALGTLTLSVTAGVQGRPFASKINGLTTGKVEVLVDGTPGTGFGVSNGMLRSQSLPPAVSLVTVVLREYEPGASPSFKDTRLSIASSTAAELRAQAISSLDPGRSLRNYRVGADPQGDGSLAYKVVAEDDLGASRPFDVGTPTPTPTPTPTVAISSAISQNEGNSGTTNYVYTVTRSAAVGAVNVPWSFAAGSTSASDFAGGTYPAGGNVAMADGVATGTITIAVQGDATVESDESFTVSISAPGGYALGSPSSATGTIVNDDVGATLGALSLSPSTATVGSPYSGTIAGKTASSTISLTGAGAAGLSVVVAAVSGTPTTAGAINLVETLAGATNTPRTTNGAGTVAAAAGPPAQFANNDAPNTGLKAAITSAKAGSTARGMWFANSIMMGAGAGDGGDTLCNNARRYSICSQATTLLRAAGVPCDAPSFYGSQSAPVTQDLYDPRIALGTFSLNDNVNLGGGIFTNASQNGRVMTLTPTDPFDYLEISVGAGNLSVKIDGAVVPYDNALERTNNCGGAWFIYPGISLGVHTIEITSTSSGNLGIFAICPRNSTKMENVQVGAFGTTTDAMSVTYGYGALNHWANTDHKFVVGGFMERNDCTFGVPVASYKSRMATILEAQRAKGATILLLTAPPQNPAQFGISYATQQTYTDATLDLGVTKNIATLDFFGKFGTYDTSGDGTHQSRATQAIMAADIVNSLRAMNGGAF